MADYALEARGIGKHFRLVGKDICVFDNIDLTIPVGKWAILSGASGCGKTTLLQLLGWLDKPDGGSIICHGINVTAMRSAAQARLRACSIGFVFQSFQLFDELDAVENVMLAGRIGGQSPVASRKRAIELLERVGVGHRLEHRPTELSGGEQQRIAIARALMNDPPIILADEPTGNLDDTNGQEVMDILSGLRADGKTIVMVTHDKGLSTYGDVIYRLDDGKLSESSDQ
ncbi:MAG: ABC-type lipoprotein export system ATPase subunit [Rhodothermales bacterium]|jgi:ABC-type lipoprotein export system ATPase subunit